MNKIARRSVISVILVAVLLVGFGFFTAQYVLNSDDWVINSGSPHVYSSGMVGYGVAVDAQGILLLDSRDGKTYSNDATVRKSVLHWVGDRSGNVSAPAMSYYVTDLSGFDLLNGVYNYADAAGVAHFTISANVQAAALEAMGNYSGTVAVYNYQTGQLLCAVSTPTFDPDNAPNIEADQSGRYDGVYMNRFTSGLYIPGSIYKIVTLAAALETVPDITQQKFTCTGSYTIGADKITCVSTHWEQDLQSAFRNSCNCAFAQIALQVGPEKLEEYAEKFGITQSISFDGMTTVAGSFEAVGAADANIAWSGIGQYNDQINPCTYLRFVGAIANDGVPVDPYIVDKITVGVSKTYQAKSQTGKQILSAETVETLQQYLRSNVADGYGDYNFGDLRVCAKTGTAEVGGTKKPNAMLVGYVSDPEYPLAFIVCAEDAGYGSSVCIPIASKVLAACKTYLDS